MRFAIIVVVSTALLFGCSETEVEKDEAELFEVRTGGGEFSGEGNALIGWGYSIGYTVKNIGTTVVTGWSVAWLVEFPSDNGVISRTIAMDIVEKVEPGEVSDRYSEQVNVEDATGNGSKVLLGFTPRFE